MEEVYGTCGAIDSYSFSGRTDARIVLDLALGAGIAESAARAGLERVRALYLKRFAGSFDPSAARILPGVEALLGELAARPGEFAIGLLTGNWEGGARIKLGPLFERFPFGSFGDDAVDRRDLPPFALERAARHLGRPVGPADALIVGDSPLDVDCARAHGIPCLAVATGWTPAAELAAEGADWVVDDLSGALEHPALASPARR